MAAPEQLVQITLKLLYLFVPEGLLWLLLKKKGIRFSFRFDKAKGHPQLNPYAKTWLVAVVIFAVTLFSQDIFELLVGQKVYDWVSGFDEKLFFLTVSLAAFDFLGVYNYLLDKKWDKISWTLLGVIVFMLFLFFSR